VCSGRSVRPCTRAVVFNWFVNRHVDIVCDCKVNCDLGPIVAPNGGHGHECASSVSMHLGQKVIQASCACARNTAASPPAASVCKYAVTAPGIICYKQASKGIAQLY
jgi:hypothetical protein